MNLLNDYPYMVNVCQANINRVVRVKYTRDFRPDDHEEVIASIKAIEHDFHLIEFGHPFDVKRKETIAGCIGLDYKHDTFDITFISLEEFLVWMASYSRFHNEVIIEKGYDAADEDIDKLHF